MASAAVAGMTADLKLNLGSRYSIALLVFFIPVRNFSFLSLRSFCDENWLTNVLDGQYFIFELPSNLVLRRVGSAVWLSSIGLSWGVVTIGMGFINDWRILVFCRALLGLFEAG